MAPLIGVGRHELDDAKGQGTSSVARSECPVPRFCAIWEREMGVGKQEKRSTVALG